jgi:UDP-N-acetylglucosamine--N-acetylmuramyl-(pentapeptide) pyrophosphoryl-undecaprenol N-acetylglucosamine transferase
MSGTVMITTGGTGGHVFPGLAVASKLVARGTRVFWLGTRDGMEATLVPRHGVDFESVRSAAFAARAGSRCCSVPTRSLRRAGRA